MVVQPQRPCLLYSQSPVLCRQASSSRDASRCSAPGAVL